MTARRSARGVRRSTWLPAAMLTAVLAAGCGVPGGSQPAVGPTGPPGSGGASATTSHKARRCTVTPILMPTCGAWWGMYLPTDPGGAGLAAAVQAQERTLGRPLDIIERYHDMSLTGNGIFPNPAEARLARQHLLLYSWSPAAWSAHRYYRWTAITSGVLDRSVIVPEAERIRAFGREVFLTFSAEPDGAVPAEGSAAEFIAAWRHVHDTFTRLGVHNVVWVWTTTGYVPHSATIAALYPGNAYVDWIAYDPYNFYNCHHIPWRSFAHTAGPFYRWLTDHHLGDSKPVMLAEFGSAPDLAHPGREAAWYRGVVPALRTMSRLKALIMWNSATPGCDLALSAASAASAYRQTGLSPYLRQPLP